MGTCVNVIKLVGFSLLGLLSASLTMQSIQSIPDLITRLNNQVTISTASAAKVADLAVRGLTVSKLTNVVLAAISSGMFYLAYSYSPALEKHPYLVYSGLGAPLALAALYVQGSGADASITKRAAGRHTKAKKTSPKSVSGAVIFKDDDDLDKSYIHVSDDSLSSLTPALSVSSSPQHAAAEMSPSTSSIEEEVADAMSKKEYVHDLETLQGAYTTSLVVAVAGAAVCAVGLVGDMYFL